MGPRFEPELIRQVPPGFVVDGECVSLPPAAVEGEHQTAAQRVAQRVLRDQLLQFPDQ